MDRIAESQVTPRCRSMNQTRKGREIVGFSYGLGLDTRLIHFVFEFIDTDSIDT